MMALNATTLKAALKAALITTAGALNNVATDKLAEVIAATVVAHIKANAVVTVAAGIPVATSGGAGATSGTGTGTVS